MTRALAVARYYSPFLCEQDRAVGPDRACGARGQIAFVAAVSVGTFLIALPSPHRGSGFTYSGPARASSDHGIDQVGGLGIMTPATHGAQIERHDWPAEAATASRPQRPQNDAVYLWEPA